MNRLGIHGMSCGGPLTAAHSILRRAEFWRQPKYRAANGFVALEPENEVSTFYGTHAENVAIRVQPSAEFQQAIPEKVREESIAASFAVPNDQVLG